MLLNCLTKEVNSNVVSWYMATQESSQTVHNSPFPSLCRQDWLLTMWNLIRHAVNCMCLKVRLIPHLMLRFPGLVDFKWLLARNMTSNAIKKFGQGGKKLYWVVPPLYYSDFTKKTAQEVDQYTLHIPYPSSVEVESLGWKSMQELGDGWRGSMDEWIWSELAIEILYYICTPWTA